MPRSVKDDPRDCFKSFRFTAAEVTRLEARARARGQSVSAYVRSLVLGREQEEDTEGLSLSQPAYVDNRAPIGRTGHTLFAVRALAEQLRRLGVNLNQIARRMNEQRTPPPPELGMLLDEIRAYVRQVREP